MNDLKQSENESSRGEGLVRGGLGLLGGVLLCGIALAAQAALLQAIAGGAKKS